MGRIKERIFISLLLAVGLNVILNEDLFAQSERKSIRIACVEYPPFTFKDGTGSSADMLVEIFDKMGYDITVVVKPLGRAIRLVNEGRIEAARLFPQTDPKVTVAIPIQYSSAVFMYKKSRFPDGLKFSSFSELRDLKIGALSNSNWSIELFQKSAGLNLDFAPDSEMNIRKLYAERIDLLPIIHITALSLMESFFPDRKEEFALSEVFHITPVCLIFSTKYPGNKNIIDDVKKKITEIDMWNILQKHFGKYFPEGVIPCSVILGCSYPRHLAGSSW